MSLSEWKQTAIYGTLFYQKNNKGPEATSPRREVHEILLMTKMAISPVHLQLNDKT